ncbi:MAG: glycosyltransferase, partial [Candidatus Falkowbacteria bacterium]|nr:glycosyltransferase [Candidatus Falkowbacteria bacterium]
KTIYNKITNKTYLQKKLGLPINKNIPLVGLVSRLVWQKGLELIDDKFGELDCQFIFLGNGQKEFEDHLKKFAKKYPDKVRTLITFDVAMAQQIYASSDIFIMPSRFEPCGLGQMIAMRYGTVPVVRATGGLADTVINKKSLQLKKANGFTFTQYNSDNFYHALKRAIDLYRTKPMDWQKLQTRGMQTDFSWQKSAREYIKLYKKLRG